MAPKMRNHRSSMNEKSFNKLPRGDLGGSTSCQPTVGLLSVFTGLHPKAPRTGIRQSSINVSNSSETSHHTLGGLNSSQPIAGSDSQMMAPTTRTRQTSMNVPSSNETHHHASTGSASSQRSTVPVSCGARKKVRGPGDMKAIWGQLPDVHLPVKFNKNHQPYGENKSKLVHFLGSIARNGNYAPINYKSWPKVPAVYKKNIEQLVKRKFEIPDGKEVWILKSLSRKWKNWKTQVKRDHYDQSLSVEAQKLNVPPRVKDDQWEDLLKIFDSEEMKARSQVNKASRAKQNMIARTGKKSFAEVAENMKEELGRSPSHKELFAHCYVHKRKDGTESTSEAAKEALEKMLKAAEEVDEDHNDRVNEHDIFSQVMGKEKNGYVRMCGVDVCPSDVFGQLPSRSTLLMNVMDMKTEMNSMKEQNLEMNKKLQDLQSQVQSGGHNVNISLSAGTQSQSSCQRHPTFSRRTIRENSFVTLRSIKEKSQVVAKGIVSSIDPSTKVGGVELGDDWCEVSVQVAVISDEQLIRPYGLFKVIFDSIGAPIAWPISLVVLDDEFEI